MYTYAKIDANGIVRGIYQSLTTTDDPTYTLTPAGADSSWIGAKRWDAELNAFQNTVRKITKLAFIKRFTTAELVAIMTAKTTDPIIETLLLKTSIAEEVDLDDADVGPGLDYLISQNLISADRKNIIMA